MNRNSIAFGAPGIEPRWTSSAKDGIGTAYHTSSCIWFTISHGIVNEIYFPYVDSPSHVTCNFSSPTANRSATRNVVICSTKSNTQSKTRCFTSSPTQTARAAIAWSKKPSLTRTHQFC